ncbi:MAG: disulfide bond formation protein DsbD [Flammeovirgaceae bacterium]|nr:disulfide bond formation protein DsbD [Flammeovirgaceae bacterium]
MRIRLILLLLGASFWCSSQIIKPIEWHQSISISDDQATAQIIFTATIDSDWYLYSSDFDPALGPYVTEFVFTPDESYKLLGSIQPQAPSSAYDSIFMGTYTYFKKTGVFIQNIQLNDLNYQIEGFYSYQVCSDVTGLCIPLEDDFSFVKPSENTTVSAKEEVKLNKSVFDVRLANDPYTLLTFMLIAFLAGLTALLTPCVFPMIPMTITYFTGRSKSKGTRIKNSLFYGTSIIGIHVLFGAIIAPFMGPEIANDLATGWFPNILFFLIFTFFALSFFGLFEITLPHKWVNTVDRMGDQSGLIGVFFMALTLVLVSFSCTGPIVGTILVESAGGLVLKPILGMLAFSTAFAIPFMFFALFPGWLGSLPKSGSWLNSVKVVLGFLELAFAFKFLSIADQAYHWGILDREIYLALWISIFTLLSLYLLGIFRMPGDSEAKNISVLGLILAIISFSFVFYLIPGLFGAPLKGMSGYLPPISGQDFNLGRSSQSISNNNLSSLCEMPKYNDFLELPHGLRGYFDLTQAKECARATEKPILIDFTGHGCVNCREMEARVWSDSRILKRLSENFIVVALYVDDKTSLPQNQWYESSYDGKIKKTIGKQNADLQITQFKNNAQPLYVIMNADGQLLTDPMAYNLDILSFLSFLDLGHANFGK